MNSTYCNLGGLQAICFHRVLLYCQIFQQNKNSMLSILGPVVCPVFWWNIKFTYIILYVNKWSQWKRQREGRWLTASAVLGKFPYRPHQSRYNPRKCTGLKSNFIITKVSFWKFRDFQIPFKIHWMVDLRRLKLQNNR